MRRHLDLSTAHIIAAGGFAGGIVLGLAGRIGRFCTLGAIEDAIFAADTRRLRMWALAIAVAIAGVFTLDQAGIVDIARSFYLARPTSLIASLAGGLMFGFGMSLVGTCGYGVLTRLGGGDLKAFVTFLVMGVSAYMALGGPTAILRTYLFPNPSDDPAPLERTGIAHFFASLTGAPVAAIALVIAALIAWFALSSAKFRNDRVRLVWGIVFGLAIVWGWLVTGYASTVSFDPVTVESYTFSAPLGESLIFLMTMSGASINFAIAAVFGVPVGALAGALIKDEFRWEACDDAIELRRQIIGGFLMGTGGVYALGCTIGQGLSAFSVLALSAPVVVASIFVGAWIGLHLLIQGSLSEAFHSLMAHWRHRHE